MKDPFNILVVGETCLDVFDFGVAKRRNPEAPSLVFNPETQTVTPGMAGNVAACVKVLDPKANVVTYHNYSKMVKRRYVDKASGYILFRTDEGDVLPKDDVAKFSWGLENILKQNNWLFSDIDCILVADYCKGFLSEEFLEELATRAETFSIPVFMDTKKILGDWSSSIWVTKINQPEYQALLKQVPNPQTYTKNLIVTSGENGATLYNHKISSKNSSGLRFSVNKVNVVNLCGAGDVFNAALALSQCKGFTLEDSIIHANKAASIKVTRQGTAVVSGEEVWTWE